VVALAPLLALLAPINAAIAAADRHIAELVATDPVVLLLTTAPTIGPVTAAAFVATLDDVTRFASADQVSAYLGLVPSEHSSGERQPRGRITKTGDTRMRWLLVEAGWRILRSTNPGVQDLKALGARYCRPSRHACRRGRARAQARHHSLRDVARHHAVSCGTFPRHGGRRVTPPQRVRVKR